MATRYITALEYADQNAKHVLKKHAKKRPLGELGSKLRYCPPQPVLSCRTVNIDVTGTRTYRSCSTTDIIQEQHNLIHNIYTKARNIASAPNRRFSPQTNFENDLQRRQKLNIEVKGRPLTSQSQSSIHHQNRAHSSIRRPRTTGTLKKKGNQDSPRDFMVLRVKESELLQTSHKNRKLTNKIHEQWLPHNHDLNTGKFVRGQQKSDAPPSLDAWLTFGGVNSEESSGVIDAFAEIKDENKYYSIEGGVGSRVAQQLQKGDKIRVGINGRIQSQDLKIKRSHSKLESCTEEKADKENMEKPVIPLCWDDQISTSKVISPREQRDDSPRPAMSETHPVVFEHDDDDDKIPASMLKARQQGTNYSKPEGFKIKHRKKSRQAMDGQEVDNIMVITIDQKSDQEDLRLKGLSLDDILQNKVKNNQKSMNSAHSTSINDTDSLYKDKSNPVSARSGISITDSFDDPRDLSRCVSKASMADSNLNVDSSRQNRSKPTSPLYYSKMPNADLVIVPSSGMPKVRSESPLKSSSSSRIGSEKPMSATSRSSEKGSAKSTRPALAKPSHMAYNSPSSFNSFGPKGEPEFIKITSQIRNPQITSRKDMYIPQSASDDAIRQVVKQNTPEEHEEEEIHQFVPAPSPDLVEPEPTDITNTPRSSPQPSLRTTSPGLAISIPTAEDLSDTSPWPSHRDGLMNGDDIMTSHSRREAAFRDSQIDQITTLLKGAIVDPNEMPIREGSGGITKTVTFQEGV